MSWEKKIKNLFPNSYNKLEKYVALIHKYNKVMNLTGFEGDILWAEGIYESIKYIENLNIKDNSTWADIGSGAGFPCIPYLIVNPKVKLTIIEPLQKRVKFLRIVKEKLNLNFEIINDRTEQVINKTFNFITARAVSSLKNLILSTYHLGNENTLFSFIKGPKYLLEIEESYNAIKLLKLQLSIQKLEINKKNLNIITYKHGAKLLATMPWSWSKVLNFK
ncbi:16S rRNA (guanine(527)-N(7))-methyltransferase RsmG [Mycoplasma phocimorsus]|uniref:16S rRNA (guanine(527)-N(7))-methyltransferase RsmG n=1 Tax=Mycoplasma phocimorsus TaxID=3045839 RepID=UPI0024C0191F|nr:16S rRNA (guanine(527)-N(7))-methyltransferase RsmG [Mycoplasma phocimorsus]MDJ1646149.1 16S rRNA (guanine(527)-N(7))-methyltransferase RsmG [Mycoplasma phocimorsus]